MFVKGTIQGYPVEESSHCEHVIMFITWWAWHFIEKCHIESLPASNQVLAFYHKQPARFFRHDANVSTHKIVALDFADLIVF